jgi:hypothetical protein
VKQLLLPFKRFRVPQRHIDLLAIANAADYGDDKHRWFYPFKTRFLREHALSDGYDLQTIIDRCWCGDGIFRGIEGTRPEHAWEQCFKCMGTGIYRERRITLERWSLNGHVFHEPKGPELGSIDYKCTFNGYITHSNHRNINPRDGRRAMLKLMLRYEPASWWRYRRAQWWFARVRWLERIGCKLYRLKCRWLPEKEMEVPF